MSSTIQEIDGKKVIYHGWLVVEEGGEGFKPYFHAEYHDENGNRVVHGGLNPEWRDPVPALEWWDARVGEPVKLLPLPVGAYRVYTEVK